MLPIPLSSMMKELVERQENAYKRIKHLVVEDPNSHELDKLWEEFQQSHVRMIAAEALADHQYFKKNIYKEVSAMKADAMRNRNKMQQQELERLRRELATQQKRLEEQAIAQQQRELAFQQQRSQLQGADMEDTFAKEEGVKERSPAFSSSVPWKESQVLKNWMDKSKEALQICDHAMQRQSTRCDLEIEQDRLKRLWDLADKKKCSLQKYYGYRCDEFGDLELAVNNMLIRIASEIDKKKRSKLRTMLEPQRPYGKRLNHCHLEKNIQSIREELQSKDEIYLKEISEIRSQHQAEIAEIEGRLANTEKSRQELHVQYAVKMQQSMQELREQYEAAANRNTVAASSAIDELLIRVDKLNSRNSELESSNAALNVRVHDLEQLLVNERARHNADITNLEADLQRMHDDMAQQRLENQQDLGRVIPAAAPHFGGIWKDGGKAEKFHDKSVIGDSDIPEEEWSPLLHQMEAAVDSRPLYTVDEDEGLHRGYFSIYRPTELPILAMPGTLAKSYTGVRVRGKLLPKLLGTFWRRWKEEYLTTLQRQDKSHKPKQDVEGSQDVRFQDDQSHTPKYDRFWLWKKKSCRTRHQKFKKKRNRI